MARMKQTPRVKGDRRAMKTPRGKAARKAEVVPAVKGTEKKRKSTQGRTFMKENKGHVKASGGAFLFAKAPFERWVRETLDKISQENAHFPDGGGVTRLADGVMDLLMQTVDEAESMITGVSRCITSASGAKTMQSSHLIAGLAVLARGDPATWREPLKTAMAIESDAAYRTRKDKRPVQRSGYLGPSGAFVPASAIIDPSTLYSDGRVPGDVAKKMEKAGAKFLRDSEEQLGLYVAKSKRGPAPVVTAELPEMPALPDLTEEERALGAAEEEAQAAAAEGREMEEAPALE